MKKIIALIVLFVTLSTTTIGVRADYKSVFRKSSEQFDKVATIDVKKVGGETYEFVTSEYSYTVDFSKYTNVKSVTLTHNTISIFYWNYDSNMNSVYVVCF